MENTEEPFDNSKDSQEIETEEKIKDPTKLVFKEIIEKEFGLIKVYDYISSNPFDLAFQEKQMDKYAKDLVYPLIGGDVEPEEVDGGRLFLREEYFQLKINEKSKQILSSAEDIAKKYGIKTHVQKQITRVNMITFVSSILIYFLGAYFFPDSITYIMIPMMLLMCFGPQLSRKYFQKKWNIFKTTYLKEILEKEKENISQIKIFTQDLLDDTRDRLLENKLPLNSVQFVLLSENYKNVKFVRVQGGYQGSSLTNIYQFAYPEGMEPIGETSSSYGDSGITEDDNDSFILLKNITFDEDGSLNEYRAEYPSKEKYALPEALLNASEFNSVDDPRVVIPSFNNNSRILCECGEPVKFNELKNCSSKLHNNFEFYLGIGQKCNKCALNPFVMFNSPGNEKIPEGLKEIFE